MAYRVKLSKRALEDITEISKYIGADISLKAQVWLTGLEAQIAHLSELPERGTSLPGRPQHRQVLYGNKPHLYRVLYRVGPTTIRVLHIRHGARAGDGL